MRRQHSLIASAGTGPHEKAGEQRPQHIGQNLRCIVVKMMNRQQIQQKDEHIAHQIADGCTNNADFWIPGENIDA